jgi:hypothetical protein
MVREKGGTMRRTKQLAAAIVGATVALLAVLAFPGVVFGETTTSHGGTPTDVYTTTEPEGCGHVDTFGVPPVLPTRVTVAEPANLLVYFTSEWAGLDSDTELLIQFRVNDDEGNFVVGTPFEWGVSNDPRLHDSGTLMWSFDDVAPGAYDVFVDARTDPVPGPPGGGNTNNNPSAELGNCALTVFVLPAVTDPNPFPTATQSPPSSSPPPSPPSVS